jgi:acyl-CoA hydrolase
MPRTHGDGLVHISELDSFVEVDYPIHEMPAHEPNDVEMRIGQHVASLVEDESCLQMGIGAIPNAALKAMENHRDLGIHSEMFSDGILDLVERGVITGRAKHRDTGKIVGGFAMGTRRLYDFMDDNPEVNMLNIQYVNNVGKIKRNKNTVAINSAIEVDFTGQVCADSIGNRIYSGVGGQMDFMRGASLSEGGKPIIALPSETKKGVSRISPFPKKAAGVVTTRAHAHYIVTEYGIANLYGKNIHQRINAMIDITHPNHREELLKEAFELYNYKQNIFGGSC